MNVRSSHCLKAVGVVMITLAFFVSLAACDSGTSKVAGTSDIAAPDTAGSPEDTAPSASPKPDETLPAPYTDEQIKALYAASSLSVIEIRDAGPYTMVYYSKQEKPYGDISRFDWFDRKTGIREFVYGFTFADKFDITADKTLTVLTTGLSPFDGYQQFPRIVTLRYTVVDGAFAFGKNDDDYYMPLEQSFTVGSNRHEALKNVCYDGGSMLLTFDEQPGYEQEFHIDGETVPRMSVTNKDGISTVTLFNTILSADFTETAGKRLGSEPCPVNVTCDGKDTVITFKMRDNAGRYNISCSTTPVECVPRAVISYEPDNFGYPKGW